MRRRLLACTMAAAAMAVPLLTAGGVASAATASGARPAVYYHGTGMSPTAQPGSRGFNYGDTWFHG